MYLCDAGNQSTKRNGDATSLCMAGLTNSATGWRNPAAFHPLFCGRIDNMFEYGIHYN